MWHHRAACLGAFLSRLRASHTSQQPLRVRSSWVWSFPHPWHLSVVGSTHCHSAGLGVSEKWPNHPAGVTAKRDSPQCGKCFWGLITIIIRGAFCHPNWGLPGLSWAPGDGATVGRACRSRSMSWHNPGLLLSFPKNLKRCASLELVLRMLWSGTSPVGRGARLGVSGKPMPETYPCGIGCWHLLFFPALISFLSLPSDLDMAREPTPSRARLGQKRQHSSSLYQ